MKSNKYGSWIDELMESENQFVVLDTHDGVHREGKITGFTTQQLNFNGVDVEFPTEIELNGDVNDRVTIDRIQSMSIRI